MTRWLSLYAYALVESMLSRQLDNLEPILTRHGDKFKDYVDVYYLVF